MRKPNRQLIHLSRRHRYPTRWKLGRYASHQSCISLGSRADDDKAKDEALGPYKRSKEERHILCLPREILFDILVYVPAEFVHNAVKYVCKQWFEIVRDPDFVKLHRQISLPGFVFLFRGSLNHGYYIESDTAALKVTKFVTKTTILCCYNAVVLVRDSTNEEILHVVNPMTKVKISLPPLVGFRVLQSIGLSVDSTGHYKVVHVSDDKTTSSEQKVQMRVFTIGVDKAWRFIDLQGIPDNSSVKDLMLESPHCFGEFIYWIRPTNWKNYLGLAMDVNTETIYQFSKPNCSFQGYEQRYVLGMGTGVGLIYRKKHNIWKLWKLTDVKSGEWTELACIDKDYDSQFTYVLGLVLNLGFTPIRLFKGDLWFYGFLRHKFTMVSYNMVNKSIETFPIIKTSTLKSSDPSIFKRTHGFQVSPKN